MSYVHAYRLIATGYGAPMYVSVTPEEIEASRLRMPGLADDIEPGLYGWGGTFQFPATPDDLREVCEAVILPELVGAPWGSTAIGPSACAVFTKIFADWRKSGNEFPESIRSQCIAFWRAFRFARGTGMVRLQPRDLLRSAIRGET